MINSSGRFKDLKEGIYSQRLRKTLLELVANWTRISERDISSVKLYLHRAYIECDVGKLIEGFLRLVSVSDFS